MGDRLALRDDRQSRLSAAENTETLWNLTVDLVDGSVADANNFPTALVNRNALAQLSFGADRVAGLSDRGSCRVELQDLGQTDVVA
ncbi:MAG TPA: hypothetical protein VEF72_31055 [Mycobacterium sp.]|nr:hypothetical protein [Mycobacterium sp.]